MSEMTRNTKRAIRTMAMVGIVLVLFSSVAMADVRLDVPMYDQKDKTWANDKLGSCSYNISQQGCAITSIAMVFKYYGVDTDPQNMNDWLTEKKYYGGSCNVNWIAADERTDGIVDWAGNPPTSLDRIKSELDNGYPVIAKVKIGGYGHYVVVTGYLETKVESKIKTKLYINDPVGGLEITIPGTRYPGSPEKEVKKIRLYHGPVIQIIDQSISPTIVKQGDELTFVYNISNPYLDKVPKIRLGAQVRTNSPQGEWTDDMSNDRVIDLASGANDYSRLFKLPLDSKAGFYDARWVIINESTKKPINSKEMIRIFEVQKEELPPPQPMLDLVILVDTTGSMWDDIENVKESANEIVEALDSTGFDYRVAVVDYRDFPEPPYGGEMDYVYNLNQPFSSDKDVIISAINDLTLGWGDDWKESVYSALVISMLDVDKDTTIPDNYGWREVAFKAIILLGDAPPHDPEPWAGGHTLDDVAYWSENIDPIRVYSVVVGYDSNAYIAFSEISEKTGGKAYLSPTASDVADTIIKAIEDMENDGYGVEVKITPIQNETNPGSSVMYSVNITNKGDVADVYDVSFEAENIVGSYRGYPLAIQHSWIAFDDSEMELDPSILETRPLVINVPENWAGMEDVIYTFSVSAESEINKAVGNTSSAELKIKANKRSMIEYSKLEIQWLSELVNGSTIDQGIKNALLAKLANAESKADQAAVNSDKGKVEVADNMLQASQNALNAFVREVDAQYDKKVSQPDAEMLKEKASQIMEDIEKAKEES